jgi:hypothetical protein
MDEFLIPVESVSTVHYLVDPSRASVQSRRTPPSERFWLNLQAQFDLDVERDRLGDRLNQESTARRAG